MIAGCSDCKDGFVARLLLIFKEHNQDLQTGICISNFKDEDTDGKIPSTVRHGYTCIISREVRLCHSLGV